ncbi:MAG TPA: inositol monophosphatase family protein [Burkholderiaceae bacterium]|nr:inositol monophosphatase family protein [Burkholderiaceae bacterium]
MHPMLNTAVKAARKAASIINRASLDLDLVRVSTKGRRDFVTEVDRAAEEAIISTLRTAYPAHAFLAEESASQRPATRPEFLWIIDPLDGTTNFIHGFPQYAVSIALEHRGQVAHAVVYDPTNNELFTASRGAGAFLNDRRLRVSRRTKLEESLIGTGLPFRGVERLDHYMDGLRRVVLETAGVRRAGAAALDLAYVAAGRLDGFWEYGLQPWDVAAGSLLILEAGGMISAPGGGADYLYGGDVVCGSPKIHAALLPLLPPLSAPLSPPLSAPLSAPNPPRAHAAPDGATASDLAGDAALTPPERSPSAAGGAPGPAKKTLTRAKAPRRSPG